MAVDVGISLMPMFVIPGPPIVWRVELSSPDPGYGELFESLMFEPVNKFYTATQAKGHEQALRRHLTQFGLNSCLCMCPQCRQCRSSRSSSDSTVRSDTVLAVACERTDCRIACFIWSWERVILHFKFPR